MSKNLSKVNMGFIRSLLREENVSYFTTYNSVYIETSNNSFMSIEVSSDDKLEICNGHPYNSIFAECLYANMVDDYRKGKECKNPIKLLQTIASELAKN